MADESGFMLDGIKTAMVVTPHRTHDYQPFVQCACGFESAELSSLRFHFTHCPKARPTPPSVPESPK